LHDVPVYPVLQLQPPKALQLPLPEHVDAEVQKVQVG